MQHAGLRHWFVSKWQVTSNSLNCALSTVNVAGSICRIMTNTAIGNEVQRLANVRWGISLVENRHTSPSLFTLHPAQVTKTQAATLPILLADAPSALDDVMAEPDFWGYQTCTEFAFYQTWLVFLF